MAIFDDENNNQGGSSPFSRSTPSRTSSMDSTKEGNIHVGSGVSVNGEINAPNEVVVNGKHTGKIAAGGSESHWEIRSRTLSVSSSGVAKGEIRYKDLEIALGGKISGTIAEMSDEDFQKSKIKLVKDEEENKKSGGGFFGTAKEEDN